MLQHRRTSKAATERSQTQKDKHRVSKAESESRIAVLRTKGTGQSSLIATRYGVSFWGDEQVLQLTDDGCTTL